mmetsp:Transcript_50477/g.80390  ORF Transcript_50477/g.80390 Transcript_50477/m.80390 type:complete len:80 (-) Transcript_50477:83-322(-)
MEMQARKRESSEQMYIDHGGATNGDLGEELANNKKPSLKQLQLSGGSAGDSMYDKPEGQAESPRTTVSTTTKGTTHGRM